ncbi:geranylgeranyl pyrophosphate synthase-like [Limulus polyphemus]|uniref:Geranylgeranyl pyrophosphate synthase-like n=1 Tax=Limulus polyphemus TaxID=6850 RepID=A0ABM1SN64_LIMPO|nr:geranylgeranyl pyrophosphate synthase-like [Limulus polyphemus]XP_022245070.1 geranylgeranyl pyrophosphate synthase-like [Limulus polyphemus]XP_022245071.1 geranylgeranyl pyrophosphate synthase-like [Limulus polyphemus]
MSVNNKEKDVQSRPTDEDKILLQPFNYILQVPGKQIRSKLTKAFNHWLNVPLEKCQVIGEVVQMLHNASLLIDDIEDNSCLRRGIPVAHHIFGVASTINTANYVYFLGLEKLLKLGKPEATVVYTEQLLELHRGQGMEIYWRDNFVCPTEEEYKHMVKRKTGGLFGLAVQLMQLFSDNKSDFTKLIGIMGLYFQIRDDYANLLSKEYTDNKSYCEDLTEGKFSFPIIHTICSHPEDPRMINIIRQRTHDVEIKKYSVDLMEKFGSFEYTRKTMEELDQEARAEVEMLGGNPHMIAVLDELKTW